MKSVTMRKQMMKSRMYYVHTQHMHASEFLGNKSQLLNQTRMRNMLKGTEKVQLD